MQGVPQAGKVLKGCRVFAHSSRNPLVNHCMGEYDIIHGQGLSGRVIHKDAFRLRAFIHHQIAALQHPYAGLNSACCVQRIGIVGIHGHFHHQTICLAIPVAGHILGACSAAENCQHEQHGHNCSQDLFHVSSSISVSSILGLNARIKSSYHILTISFGFEHYTKVLFFTSAKQKDTFV